jgi:hypothetical protein
MRRMEAFFRDAACAKLRLLFETKTASENSRNWTKIRLRGFFRGVFLIFAAARCAQIRLKISDSTKIV